ncbi:cyanophycinase [Hymenobacter chitinivorans]|uniref:Cyanophycinase n=1 Tax=Hymenobacter chitinivorans DSM 11115 TaxID=1121954 RepID=A0A2M9B5Y4_9BACT|nr:cyanophycinase [Hymenobacter chitinivorans]PJJ53354.1 cyanophycinase [Hymenobacter chitinivorans DSM 11115]
MPGRKKKTTRSQDPSRPTCPLPQGILIAVGGHENKGEEPEKGSNQDNNRNFVPDGILQRFVQELVGHDPLVLVVPTASSVPEEAARDYHEVFRRLGVGRIETLNVQQRSDANDEKTLQLVNEAAGFWFTGGDQLRLTAILGGTHLLQRLKERYAYDKIVIGGTSAGATAMSTPMIYEGRNDAGFRKGEIAITTGLRFMHDVAIDTHFIARGRIARMAQIIATNPTCMGMGLEEDTGVIVREGYKLEVIGSGLVTLLEGSSCTATNIYDISNDTPFSIRDLVLHFLSAGEEYELPITPDMYQ